MTASPQPPAARRVRVLVADDEPHIRAFIKAIVARLGGEVVAEAGDGEEAVALYRRERPEITLLDINMPRLAGDQALLRILEINPRALVVMLTAQDSIESVHRCIDRGARNYVLKNTAAEEILALISESWRHYVAELRQEPRT